MPNAETIDQKLRCLAVLVNEFLERDIVMEDLKRDPDQIEQLRELLVKNLWAGNIDPHDPDWSFDSHLADATLDNPDLYSEEDLQGERIEVGARTLLYIQRFLRWGFWEKFKREVLHQQEMEALSRNNPLAYHGAKSSLPLELPSKNTLPCSFEGGTIHFYQSGAHAILALVNLLQGLPIDIFRICKDKSCGRCFIRVHKHGKEYCCQRCASRHNQSIKREEDREKFNRYHRQYYQEIEEARVSKEEEVDDGKQKKENNQRRLLPRKAVLDKPDVLSSQDRSKVQKILKEKQRIIDQSLGHDGTAVSEYQIVDNIAYSREIISEVRQTYNPEKLVSLRKHKDQYLQEGKKQILATWHGTISLSVHTELYTTLFLIAMGTLLVEIEASFEKKSQFVNWRRHNFSERQTRYFQQAVQLAKMGMFAKRYAAMGKKRLLQIEHIRKVEGINSCEELLLQNPPERDIKGAVIPAKAFKENPIPDISEDLDGDLVKRYADSVTTFHRLKHAGIDVAEKEHANLIAAYKKQAITVREAENIKDWLDKHPKKERAELFDNYIMDRMVIASEHTFQLTGPNYSFNHLVAKLLNFLREAEYDNKEWIEAQRKILDDDATLEAHSYLTLFMKKMGLKSGDDKKEKKP